MAKLIDASTDRLVCLDPARVPRKGSWPTYDPPAADYANPAAQPIYGHPVRALPDGGPWNTGERPPILTNSKGIPRSRKIASDPTGRGDWGVDEPPPEISNQRWTMQLVRSMFRAGWSLDQTDAAMDANRKAGGWYWHYRCWTDSHDEDHPEHYARQLWATLIETEKIQGMPIGVITDPPVRREFVWEARKKDMISLVVWISRHPQASQAELIRARIVAPYFARHYLDYMHAAGMIFPVPMMLPDARGRHRRMKVWRVINDDHKLAQKIEIFAA